MIINRYRFAYCYGTMACHNTDVWMLPLVYASLGYGDHGIVGGVGSITIDSRTGTVVAVTPRDEAVALVRKLHEENREAIEAAFYSAAAKMNSMTIPC